MPDRTVGHQPELLTMSEAAELLRAPVATLRYWRHCNIGPRSFRLGRRVLYRRDDVHAWIDQQRKNSEIARRTFRSAAKSTLSPSMAGSDETEEASDGIDRQEN